eukprot:CAMPEP_0194766946 /NCGR_PEP_ID=MMETSP0323_2-20130528/33807_1 /TAXON_ID=2866 ORGANISM="Crypthecodinium cohnii, Strain Seligo" /NCGR_SAMPLE_ID=MMETSP0323_2 /ASSEMBLY_ACC=CAM_ASM_000346 /LENGTH=63 /DNA_ID=CAMNT_0039698275 /DNA_START=244 /DNA_END=435 /DNA_ORIENTATION=-
MRPMGLFMRSSMALSICACNRRVLLWIEFGRDDDPDERLGWVIRFMFLEGDPGLGAAPAAAEI